MNQIYKQFTDVLEAGYLLQISRNRLELNPLDEDLLEDVGLREENLFEKCKLLIEEQKCAGFVTSEEQAIETADLMADGNKVGEVPIMSDAEVHGRAGFAPNEDWSALLGDNAFGGETHSGRAGG